MLPFLLFLLSFHMVWAAPYCTLTSSSDLSAPSPATGTSAGGNATGTGGGSDGSIVAATWWASWHSADSPLSSINWAKYSSVIYSFAQVSLLVTTNDVNTIGLQTSDEQLIPQFVGLAHQNNVNAILSVGGWTGSQYFSTAVSTDANRTAFAQAVMKLVSQYGLDGIEFDWEYPNRQGIGCNILSPNDSSNFLSFLQTLRSQNGASNLTLSAAVSVTPFVGSDGAPMSDVSGFAKVLDYIEVMNYDIWGSWSTSVGPNAPLNDTCVPSGVSPQGSAVSAVNSWTKAGFPANQIILGVASYGHSFHVDSASALGSSGSLVAYPPFDKSQQPHGDSWDSNGTGPPDQCGNPPAVGGTFDFWGLIQGGFLNSDGTPKSGIDYMFDNCSQTPFVYNSSSQVMVSYDDATSFTAKGKFIADVGLAGFAMWEAGGDSNNILLNAISEAWLAPGYLYKPASRSLPPPTYLLPTDAYLSSTELINDMSFCKHCISGVRLEGTPEGTFETINGIKTYVAKPTVDYPKDKALLFLPDVFGFELENNRLLVDDFAKNGFQVYFPDLFDGDAVPADAFNNGDFDLNGWFRKNGPEKLGPRIDAVIKGLKEQGVTRFGATGYCFGVRYVFNLALENKIDVAVASHPTLIEFSDLEKYFEVSKAPLLINSCEFDPQFTAEKQAKADEVLGNGKFAPGYQRLYFAGCTHGFMSDPTIKAAKEAGFKASIEWLVKYL
ncbi:hypothetical protein EW146_g2328 [Bondarzewia mesenterica]|uniref:GH18 domain-containing protein n=1 Tax=Bondarzewia mesenterica TaxID=1095465 RepID=A0A4S4M3B4_9AGAM|nr:hypothetical protein EW146_g2328 [Bondarzewia mesenterica]